MKTRIYLRIGKQSQGKPKVAVSLTPNREALTRTSYSKEALPTILIGLDLDIPDKEFEATRVLLEAKIKETQPAIEIKQIIEENGNKKTM